MDVGLLGMNGPETKLGAVQELLLCFPLRYSITPALHGSIPKLVLRTGIAPVSSGYQPDALLLSYETVVNCGFAPNRFTGRNTRFNRCGGRIRSARFGL